MRRFLRNIALFAIPFAGILLWLWFAPYPRRAAYMQVQKDCPSGMWVYRRIHENPKPIDIALIGTSRTMCGIIDSLLADTLSARAGKTILPANLGICRNGTDLHLTILSDLLAHKRPRTLVVEVHRSMPVGTHPHHPVTGGPADILLPRTWAQPAYPAQVADYTWAHLEHWRARILGIDHAYPEDRLHPDFSFLKVPQDVTADPQELSKARERRQEKAAQTPGALQDTWASLEARYPQATYARIAAECKQAGVQLHFLYLPGHPHLPLAPRDSAFLRSLAPVLIPPAGIFNKPENFFDPDHLNQKGAHQLSRWLADTLATLHR